MSLSLSPSLWRLSRALVVPLVLSTAALVHAQSLPTAPPGPSAGAGAPMMPGAGPGSFMMPGHGYGHGHGYPQAGGMPRAMGPMAWLRGVNLTDAQQDRIFEIHHAMAPQLRERMKVLRQTRRDLTELSFAPEFDAARAKALADTRATALSEVAQMRARGTNEVWRLLTPEQRKQVETQRRGMDPRRGPMMMGDLEEGLDLAVGE